MKTFYLIAIIYIAIAIAMLQGVKGRQDGVVNPFDAYADVMPGNRQPAGWSCSSEQEFYPLMEDSFYCSRMVQHPSIVWVSVSGRDGVIRRTAFGVRLRYADLVAAFGGAWVASRSGNSIKLVRDNLTAYTFRRVGSVMMSTRVRYFAIVEAGQ